MIQIYVLYDLHGLDKYIKKIKPHLVIHLAAMAGVRYSMDNAQEYVDNNVTGTLNLIQVLEKHDIENVIYASTSCVMHGNPLPWKESDKLGPQLSPYGYTKQLNEHMFVHFDCYLRGFSCFFEANVKILTAGGIWRLSFWNLNPILKPHSLSSF